MSINSIGATGNQSATRVGDGPAVDAQNQAGQNNSKAVAGVAGSDTVNITSTGAKLQQVAEVAANAPDVDVKRVEEIKKAIADGTFEVDPNRVAEKMIAFDTVVSKAGS